MYFLIKKNFCQCCVFVAFSGCGEQGSLLQVCKLLTVVASFVAEDRLQSLQT